jgi:hypothetical protein
MRYCEFRGQSRDKKRIAVDASVRNPSQPVVSAVLTKCCEELSDHRTGRSCLSSRERGGRESE